MAMELQQNVLRLGFLFKPQTQNRNAKFTRASASTRRYRSTDQLQWCRPAGNSGGLLSSIGWTFRAAFATLICITINSCAEPPDAVLISRDLQDTYEYGDLPPGVYHGYIGDHDITLVLDDAGQAYLHGFYYYDGYPEIFEVKGQMDADAPFFVLRSYINGVPYEELTAHVIDDKHYEGYQKDLSGVVLSDFKIEYGD